MVKVQAGGIRFSTSGAVELGLELLEPGRQFILGALAESACALGMAVVVLPPVPPPLFDVGAWHTE
jgi:hypothetical protein